MAFGSLFAGHPEENDKQRELSELQKQHASLQQAYDRGKVEYDQVMAAKLEDQKELSASREQNINLQKRINALENELQACKDDLFRLQPLSQVPDSIIAQRFENLDNVICNWIDTEISQFMDEWGSKYPNVDPKLFHHNGDPAIKTILAKYPNTGGEHVIRSIVHRHFQKKLFADRVFLFGVNARLLDSLKLVEEHMSRMQPPREAATIRAWRSETLTSITNMSDFPAWVTTAGCQLAAELWHELCKVFCAVDGKQDSLESFYDKVVTVAVELAVSMQTSTTPYVFEPRMSRKTRFTRYILSKADLGLYRMIDVATGKALKPDSPIVPDRYGNIGNQIMILAPQMLRCDKDKRVSLIKEIVLVELHNPLGHRRNAIVELEDLLLED